MLFIIVLSKSARLSCSTCTWRSGILRAGTVSETAAGFISEPSTLVLILVLIILLCISEPSGISGSLVILGIVAVLRT